MLSNNIEFGDKLADEYGLSEQICKNYLLLIGVEAAKMAYTRTGSSLKLPEDLMFRIYNQSENVFKEKNYMEGLNKMIDEIGDQMIDPFKYETTTSVVIETEATTAETTTEDPSFNISSSVDLIWTEISTTQASVKQTVNNPWWMFVCLGIAILSTIIVLIMVLISKRHTFKTLQMQTVIPVPITTTKSNCPSDDNNSDRFATITIPRRRVDLETEIKNEEEKQQKHEIKDEEAEADQRSQVTVASDEEHSYRITEAITSDNNNISSSSQSEIHVESPLTSPKSQNATRII
uniref:TPM domain-containing protein n=1 Tax=Panagrolaimus superbus TaxID=310955 RepID=A0A914XS00_9BILA